MKKVNLYWIVTLLNFLLSGCGGEKEKPTPELWKPEKESEIQPYTSAIATSAFDSFNEVFYNTDAHLYYSTSDKTDLAVGWTQAVMYDIVMDAYLRTNNPAYFQMIKDFYAGANDAYSNFNWQEVKYEHGWIYDDMMWWVISLTRAYRITGDQEFLDKAINGFNFVWSESYDPVDGGMIWSWKADGKVAAVNYPTVIGAMNLYQITEDDNYLNKAIEIYEWADNNLFQEETGRVADHKVGNNPPGFEDYTYNQGTCIGAAIMLYNATGDEKYLDDAEKAAEYTKNIMSDENGILPAEGDWNEQGVLKAIFARHVMKLIHLGGYGEYEEWLKMNANLAWHNRDKNRDIMFRNYKVKAPILTIQSYEASSAVEIMQVVEAPGDQ